MITLDWKLSHAGEVFSEERTYIGELWYSVLFSLFCGSLEQLLLGCVVHRTCPP